MNNQDSIFDKIKSAAENTENKDFPQMEKIWSRVDAKLDTKLKKQSTNWKNLIIAASFLVVGTIGFLLINSDKITKSNQEKVTKNNDVTENSPLVIESKEQIVATDSVNPYIKKEATVILDKQVKASSSVAVQDNNEPLKDEAVNSVVEDDVLNIEKPSSKSTNNQASSEKSGKWLGNRNFESRGVTYNEVSEDKEILSRTKKTDFPKKLDPLVVIDNKVSKKSKEQLNKTELDSIIELKEPIYYINKILYTEEELFGPNPTSPYAPLNKQDIETISIIQPEKAKAIYGKRGEKGVVIITTKEGKPKPKKE